MESPLLFGAGVGAGGRAPGGESRPETPPTPPRGLQAQVSSFATSVAAALGIGRLGTPPLVQYNAQPETLADEQPNPQVMFYGSTTREEANEAAQNLLMQPSAYQYPPDDFGAGARLDRQLIKMAAKKNRDYRLKEAVNTMWPQVFTLICLSVFSSPICAAFHMARDPSVRFWVGGWGYLPLSIPMLLALCYMLHIRTRSPRMIPIILGTVIPSIILIITANEHLAHTGDIAHVLVSKDCTTYTAKHDMQRSWAFAATLYERCINRTVAQLGLPFQAGLDMLRLDHCSEYIETELDPYEHHRRNWRYLARLEEEYHCSGWCWRTRPLWTFQEVKDPCAATVGFVLLDKVIPSSSRIMAYSVTCGLIAIFSIIAGSAHFRQKGSEWALL